MAKDWIQKAIKKSAPKIKAKIDKTTERSYTIL